MLGLEIPPGGGRATDPTTAPPQSATCRLVLHHRYRVVAEALALVIGEAGYEVVGVTTRPNQIGQLVTDHGVDIVVATMQKPSEAALAWLRRLASHSQARVVVLTDEGGSDLTGSLISAGAAAVVSKDSGIDHLLRAVERVRAGEVYFDSALVSTQRRERPDAKVARRIAEQLTPRERQTLQLLVDGNDTRTIEEELGLSRATVRTHIQAVITKLGVHSRLEAVTFAIRYGLVAAPGNARSAEGRAARIDSWS